MNAECENRYQLAPGVCYRLVEHDVYVRNVTTRHDYFFNPMVKDIFDILLVPHTKAELISEIGRHYAVDNVLDFPDRIDRFLVSMAEKHVIDVILPEGAMEDRKEAESLSRGFYQRERRLWNVCFELTYRCNERCRHCYLDDYAENESIGIVRFDVYRRVIDQIADMGCMNVLVTGGEPTLHPDFIDICKYITNKRMLLDVFTNALNLSDDVFEALVTMHANTVSFSMYGSREFHDYITQVPGSFDKSIQNILMLKSAGLDVFIKTVLFKGHMDEYLWLKKFSHKIRIPLSCGQTVIAGHSGEAKDTFAPDEKTLLAFLEDEAKTDPFWKKDDVPLREMDLPVCGVGLSTIAVRPNGDLVPCIKFNRALGNIKTDTFRDVWEHSEVLAQLRSKCFRDVSPKCSSCPDSGFCHVCPAIAFSESGHLAPCGYSCRDAALKHDFFKRLKRKD